MHKARLARFYGWSDEQIQRLEVSDFVNYLFASEEIKAQETLADLLVMDWPNMKQEERDKRFEALKKVAYPRKFVKGAKQVSNKDLFELLRKR